MLRYHSKTFQLLGIEPRRTPSAVEAVRRAEDRIGRALPASVSEWYELEDACRLLLEYSNDDPPVAISDLGKPESDTCGGGLHDLLASDLLVFRWENQGVCAWAIHLNGSDDPPVVVDVDTQFKSWIECAPAFSQHLYALVWDYSASLARLRKDELLIQAQNPPLSPEAIAFLRKHFQSELVTHGWPGQTQYRFFREDQRILIWAGEGRADWFLTANGEESLERLMRSVSPADDVGKALWSHTAAGEALVTKARAQS